MRISDWSSDVCSSDLMLNGVTTMLNMGEATNAFAGRTRIAVNKGAVPGPHIFTALAVDGDPQYGHLVIKTPEDERAIGGIAKANGYSVIKAYTNLSEGAFAALAEEAKAQGMGMLGDKMRRRHN